MRSRRTARRRGFTLLELMIVVAVIGIVASIAIPMYQTALTNARVAKCIGTLKAIATDIESFRLMNGRYPYTLAEAGWGGRLDPWGNGYEYLVIETQLAAGTETLNPGGRITGGSNLSIIQALTPDQISTILTAIGGSSRKDLTLSTIKTVLTRTEIEDLIGSYPQRYIRKSSDLFPLNTGYDLYSMGVNGRSAARIDQEVSLDDVIRANDGRYYGLAGDY